MSLRLRLTLLNTLLLLVVVGTLGGGAYALLVDGLERQVDDALREQARLYGANPVLVERAARPVVVLPNLQRFAGANTFIQLTDYEGNLEGRSQNLEDERLPLPEPALRSAQSGREWFGVVEIDGERLRLLVTPLYIAGATNSQLIIQVARPLAQMQQTLGTLRATGIAVGGASVLVALAAGWLLARAALSPIDVLARTADRIGALRDFAQRTPLRGSQRDEIGRLASAFNRMLDELRAAHEQQADTLASQRRFVADASHELRTPLATLRGNLDLLAHMRGDCAACDTRQHDILDDLSAETERMGRLVADLLLLAQADAGQHLTLRPVDVGPVARSAVRSARVLRPDVQLASIGEFHGLWVRGDADRLHQVLLILLDNALKMTPPNGRVVLMIEREVGGCIALSVADSGPGIPSAERERIFHRFYRGAGARSGEGTGLGLAIARWIVAEHGGSIEVSEAAQGGAVFTLSLPIAAVVQPDFSAQAA